MLLWQVVISQVINNTSLIQNNINTIPLKDSSSTFLNMPLTDNWANLGIAIFTLLGVSVNAIFVYLVLQQIRQTNIIIGHGKEQVNVSQRQVETSQKQMDISQEQSKISQEQTKTMVEELDTARKNLELFKESNNCTREEMNNRLRPWLGLDYSDLRRVPGGDPLIEKGLATVDIRIKNYGIFPATRYKSIIIPSTVYVDITNNYEFPANYWKGALMPGQEVLATQMFKKELIEDVVSKGSKLYFVVYIHYYNELTGNMHKTYTLYEYMKIAERYVLGIQGTITS